MRPTLTNPTGRKTEAHIYTDEKGNEYFFSYETCIAYRGERRNSFHDSSHIEIRRGNHWGPTTGRHFSELGCKGFDVLKDQEFHELIEAE